MSLKIRHLLFAFFVGSAALPAQTKVHTEDLQHFFEAFDSVQTTQDKTRQLAFVQNLYLERGSAGLKTFVQWGGANAEKCLRFMQFKKAKLQEMRPYLLAVSEQAPRIEQGLEQLRRLYPAFKQGQIFFIMGVGFVGGTPDYDTGNLILGAEVLMKKDKEWAVPSALHEFVHLQQKRDNGQLLATSINEGMADFVAELLYEKNLAANGYAPHITFGLKHERAVWDRFKTEMFVIDQGFLGWLYAEPKTIGGKQQRDLGYFMGYQICKSYYTQQNDKQQAIRNLLELDLSDNEKARAFLRASGYVPARDLDLVKTSAFTNQKPGGNAPKRLFGYKNSGGQIVFQYTVPADLMEKIPIESVSLAGAFNNWNPADPAFQMKAKGRGRYELRLPKKQLEAGKTYAFKFVINGDMWMPAPDNASNVLRDGGNVNLTVVPR
jgi:hypothetical protein